MRLSDLLISHCFHMYLCKTQLVLIEMIHSCPTVLLIPYSKLYCWSVYLVQFHENKTNYFFGYGIFYRV